MSKKLDDLYAQLDLGGNNFLHTGIRGMHWGVRRSDKQLHGTSASSDSVDAVRAHTTSATIKKHGSLSAVSDADLNHLINRISAEKRFSEVNPKGLEKGHQRIKTLLKVGVTMNEAIKFINSPAGHLLSAGIGMKSAGKHAKPLAEVLKAAGKKKNK
jgi:hypothetical protein